jgi:predicted Zn-dependent protease
MNTAFGAIARQLLLLLLGVGVLYVGLWWLVGRVVSTEHLERNRIELITVKQEMQIGDQLAKLMLSESRQLTDLAILGDAMHQMTERLLAQMPDSPYKYKFYVIHESVPNAFAMPGGHIVVHSGLIQLAESPEELAAVLAHEIGHIEHRHVISKLAAQVGTTVLLSLAGGDATVLAQVLQALITSSYSRDLEREADEFGLTLCVEAGIHPDAMARIFTRLRDASDDQPGWMEALASHPDTASRIQKAKQWALPADFESRDFDDLDWAKVQEALDSYFAK